MVFLCSMGLCSVRKSTSVKIPETLEDEINTICEEDAKSQSAVIIDALVLYIKMRKHFNSTLSRKFDQLKEGKLSLPELSKQLGLADVDVTKLLTGSHEERKTPSFSEDQSVTDKFDLLKSGMWKKKKS